MNQYLIKYFARYKKLILPGIGSFSVTTQPAHLEFVEKTLHAPVHTVSFQQQETADDENFISFLIKETGLNQYEVAEKFKEFITQLKQKLHSGISLQLPGIGVLANNGDSYLFTADGLQQFFPGVTAEKVLRQNAQHSVRVGEDERTSTEMHELLHQEATQDRWWIGAIVLGVIGLGAVLYYYFSK